MKSILNSKGQIGICVAVIAMFCASCHKGGTSKIEEKKPVEAEAYHGQAFRSLDGNVVLTLISRDECELQEAATTLLCKYSKQSDALRVVLTAMGTNQVLYFRFTQEGLRENNGLILYAPDQLKRAADQARIARENEERARQEAAQRKIDEENRRKMELEQKMSDYIAWLRGYFAKGQQHEGAQQNWRWTPDNLFPFAFTLTLTSDPIIKPTGIPTRVTFEAKGKLHWHGRYESGRSYAGHIIYFEDQANVELEAEYIDIYDPNNFGGSIALWYIGSDGQKYHFDSAQYLGFVAGRGFKKHGFYLEPAAQ